MSECGCTPGTYEDGWQEHRAEECKAQEREAWRAAVVRMVMMHAIREDEEEDA